MSKVEPRPRFSLVWVPISVLAIIIASGQLLTGRYRWLSTSALLAVMAMAAALEIYTAFEERHSRYARAMFATTLVLITLTIVEIEGVVHLVILLLSGDQSIHGAWLLISGTYYWASNVLAFGLWFWLIDRGGPPARAQHKPGRAEFFFPEMAAGDSAPAQWEPGVTEYMYLAFTNATAFSPTDTLPLSRRARVLMTAESVVSLAVIALVTARAVNILR